MIIESQTHRGESRSASLMLPPQVLTKLEQANELGDVMDEVFGTDNIKQKGGERSACSLNISSPVALSTIKR